MTKITLEWVANIFNCGPAICSNNRDAQCAALCRSAQAVIEAVQPMLIALKANDADIRNDFWVRVEDLKEALAAHARNEQGTGEQP